MTRYYACKMGSQWKFTDADNLDGAFRKTFGSSCFNPSAHRVADPYEIGILLGTRKLEALSRFNGIQEGKSSIAHCGYCGTSYIVEPNRTCLRPCPGDCGRTISSDGKPL